MQMVLTEVQRAELEAAVAAETRTRAWKRYQAVLLVADGQTPAAAATAVRCHLASIYHWVASWRQEGAAGLAEGAHPGAARRLDSAGEALLAALLASDPQQRGHQTTGWTVPLLQGELVGAGYAVSTRTVRRALHRLDYRWKRPHYVLGRPDPDYAEKRGP